MVAVGDEIRATKTVPDAVPFAVADTSGWHDVPVLAELVTSFVHDLGDRVFVPVHLGLVVATLTILSSTARARGATDGWVAAAVQGWSSVN